MEHLKGLPQPHAGLPFPLDRELIEAHLAQFSTLDRTGLLNTLIPHRTLPEHDPARYVIEHHRHDHQHETPAVQSSYDLGVVFGRSLLQQALTLSGHLPPVITRFDEEKKDLVDRYLNQAVRKNVKDLTTFDKDFNHHLRRAIDLFCARCEVVVPDLLLDGNDEVVRGVHDYLSVVTLLETQADQRKSSLKRRLGVATGIGAGILQLLRQRSKKASVA